MNRTVRLRPLIGMAVIAGLAYVAYSTGLNAQGQILQPTQQLRLSDLIPKGTLPEQLKIEAATSSHTGVFILCSGRNPDSTTLTSFLIRVTEQGKYVSAKELLPGALPSIAADDAGNVAVIGVLPDKSRKAYILTPEGGESGGVIHPNISRVAALNGRFYGLWDNGILLLPSDQATASEVVFNASELLLNDGLVPITGNRLAFVRRSDASVAILDVASGTVALPAPIDSPEIKLRSPAPPSIVKHDSRTVTTNALKSVSSNGLGGILVSPTGHPFHQSVVLETNDQAVVTRTHRFLMAKWDDLKTPVNPYGYMQGHMVLKTSNHYLWLNRDQARIAIYDTL